MKEALSSSETSVLTRATWRNIPEDAILHSHRRENLKSYSVKVNFEVKWQKLPSEMLGMLNRFMVNSQVKESMDVKIQD
jgi:hypothetical protein